MMKKGFVVRLDGRELIVLSFERGSRERRQMFSLTTEGREMVEDAVVFDS